MFEIKNQVQTMKFDGELLAKSSSEGPGKDRWVEFSIYLTDPGRVYVVSRVGMSRIYHSSDCHYVSENHLSPVDPATMRRGSVACKECTPNWADEEGVFPERPRHTGMAFPTARGAISFVTRKNKHGASYLTNVVRTLLEEASLLDDGIRREFMTEVIN